MNGDFSPLFTYRDASASRYGTAEYQLCERQAVLNLNARGGGSGMRVSVSGINGLHGEAFKHYAERASNSARTGVLSVGGAVRAIAQTQKIRYNNFNFNSFILLSASQRVA